MDDLAVLKHAHDKMMEKAKESGLNIKGIVMTHGDTIDAKTYDDAMLKKDWEKVFELNREMVDTYISNVPKLTIQQGVNTRTIDVTVSSSKSDDDAILHYLQKATK